LRAIDRITRATSLQTGAERLDLVQELHDAGLNKNRMPALAARFDDSAHTGGFSPISRHPLAPDTTGVILELGHSKSHAVQHLVLQLFKQNWVLGLLSVRVQPL
jgi:hypothetical protein